MHEPAYKVRLTLDSTRAQRNPRLTHPLLCRQPMNVADKMIWVQKHLGKEWLKRVIITSDKTLVRGRVLIDDKMDITGSAKPAWEHVLFAQPFQTHFPPKPRQRVLRHWGDWRALVGAPPTPKQQLAHALEAHEKRPPVRRHESIADGWALGEWVQSLPISQVISRHLERMAPQNQTAGGVVAFLGALGEQSSSELLFELLAGAWKEAAELLRTEAQLLAGGEDSATQSSDRKVTGSNCHDDHSLVNSSVYTFHSLSCQRPNTSNLGLWTPSSTVWTRWLARPTPTSCRCENFGPPIGSESRCCYIYRILPESSLPSGHVQGALLRPARQAVVSHEQLQHLHHKRDRVVVRAFAPMSTDPAG